MERTRVLVGDAILPFLVITVDAALLRDPAAYPLANVFEHQVDGMSCAPVAVVGFGLRLEDNLASLPPGGHHLTIALQGMNAGAAGGDPWFELRKTLGDDALLRFRVGEGKCVEELVEACASMGSPENGAVTSAAEKRRWQRLLAEGLGAFPEVTSAREALITSELCDAIAMFGDWRVVTFSGSRPGDVINLCDSEMIESFAMRPGPPLREVLGSERLARVGSERLARVSFLWCNSD